MRIIISPAKQMVVSDEGVPATASPALLPQARRVLGYLGGLSLAEAKKLWGCSDALAEKSYQQLRDLLGGSAGDEGGVVAGRGAGVACDNDVSVGGVVACGAGSDGAGCGLGDVDCDVGVVRGAGSAGNADTGGFGGAAGVDASLLTGLEHATPAILAYDGIAFKYMAPSVFEDGQFDYVQDHLRILSGLFGVLRPLDGVVPYRLEMQAKAPVAGSKNLYDFWGRSLYDAVMDEGRVVVNLASREYSKCIERYLQPEDTMVTCVFGELSGGKVVQKGVYAKMARGDMVRYMAENNVESPEGMQGYNRLGYAFAPDYSDEKVYTFLK